MHRLLDKHPIPIEIFSADGLSLYVNEECMKMVGSNDASLLVGIYNFRTDPVCIEIMGQESIDRIFAGETLLFEGFPAPIQDVYHRGLIDEKPWEAATMDLYFQPLWKGSKFICSVCYFFVHKTYTEQTAVAKALEYLDRNWKVDFYAEETALAANVSSRHLYSLFKQHLGMTPHQYYKNIKVDHLKEMIANTHLSIKEAFAACGVDSRGTYARVFKELTTMTPTQYRESL
jgi:AraC-like DNA-binding protein